MHSEDRPAQFRVLIAGAGVAGLEAALTLRELAGDRVAIQLLSPEQYFTYRPLEVRTPFAGPDAPRFELATLAEAIGAELIADRLLLVDESQRFARTVGGRDLPYDALILALGARPHAQSFPHARTLQPGQLDEQLHRFVQDVEQEYVTSAAFIVPDRVGWPLPLYELLLQTAERATAMLADVQLTLVTSEQAPLDVFGPAVAAELAHRLAFAGVKVFTGAHAELPAATVVNVTQGEHHTRLDVSTAIALPELVGPAIDGIPCDEHGFIPVDDFGHVAGNPRVFAAGDGTDGQIKQGGVSSQQAVTVATAVAALASVAVVPEPFRPQLHGVLVTGGEPLILTGPSDALPNGSVVKLQPGAPAPAKIAATHLGPFLAALEPVAAHA